jgi:hypothetical protein
MEVTDIFDNDFECFLWLMFKEIPERYIITWDIKN